MPYLGRLITSRTSRTILTMPKRAFSTKTQEALRSPTSTLSCRVNMAQATTAPAKIRPMRQLASSV